jgi:hypothetical protein
MRALGENIGCMSKAPPAVSAYTLVVYRTGRSLLSAWGWEVYREGKPLPARLRRDGFRSELNATRSGNAALREFLLARAREQGAPE